MKKKTETLDLTWDYCVSDSKSFEVFWETVERVMEHGTYNNQKYAFLSVYTIFPTHFIQKLYFIKFKNTNNECFLWSYKIYLIILLWNYKNTRKINWTKIMKIKQKYK